MTSDSNVESPLETNVAVAKWNSKSRKYWKVLESTTLSVVRCRTGRDWAVAGTEIVNHTARLVATTNCLMTQFYSLVGQ